MTKKTGSSKCVAAIDIGSRSIRMTIAQINGSDLEILDELQQAVRLGKDSFYKGKISRTTIDEAIAILNRFKKICTEYRVTRIRAVTTTAVREASNVDIFVDNIRTFTGLELEILTPSKESEYIYRTLSRGFKEKECSNEQNAIIEVGSGSVEVTVFNKDFIIFSTSLPLGALKLQQTFSRAQNSVENFRTYLKSIIEHELRNLKRTFNIGKIKSIYGIGSELEILKGLINSESGKEGASIELAQFKEIYNKTKTYSDEEIIHKLKVPHDLGETFYPALLIFLSITDLLHAERVFIPRVSLKRCIIADMMGSLNNRNFFNKLQKQLKQNAIELGERFSFDRKHAEKVMELSLKIFDLTRDIHRMGNMEKCYLVLASMLHDIGLAISNSSHHKHSQYIIKAQEFFYFNSNQKNIIANIARYHRRSSPKSTHPDYVALCHQDRMTVMKLASILRLGESLDNSHLQLVRDLKVDIHGNRVTITAMAEDEIFAETNSFKSKKELFVEFFGYTLKLKVKRI